MKFDIEMDDWGPVLDAITGRMGRAAKGAMKEAADGAKGEIRGQVRSKFKRTPPRARRYGQDFVKSFRGDVYPEKGESLEAAAAIYGKASFSGYLDEPSTVSGSPYLAIPLPAARRAGLDRGWHNGSAGRRFKKKSMTDEARKRFGEDLVVARFRRKLMIGVPAEKAAEHGLRAPKRGGIVGLFVLRRQVRLDPRLDARGIIRRWSKRIDQIYKEKLGRG